MENKLYNLVNLSNDYKNLLEEFPFLEKSIVIFTKENFIDILDKFIIGEISLIEIEKWCEIIEFNDYIKYKSLNNDLLNDLIFEIANPEINWVLTYKRAREIINLINKNC